MLLTGAIGDVSPAYAGVKGASGPDPHDSHRQPRVCGGRGWAVKSDGCLHLSAPRMRG